MRRQLGIAEGSQLVALVEDGGVLLLPRAEVRRRLRSMFAGVGRSLGEELKAERRRESAHEDAGG